MLTKRLYHNILFLPMLELPHALAGATIASKLNNPFLVFPLAFLSNFLLDILPHWNPHLYTEITRDHKISKKSKLIVFTDATLALFTGTALALRFYPDFSKILLVLFSCFFAVLADLLEAPYFFLNSQNKYVLKLISFQRRLQWNVPPTFGILSQIIFIAFCFFFIFS